MSLRKSPTLTPARIEASRRNSLKSTGLRTERGKRQSRMNSLRAGNRSRLMHDLLMAVYDAPPGGVGQVARALLTPEQAAHPLFADLVDMFQEADNALMWERRDKMARVASRLPALNGETDTRIVAENRVKSAGMGSPFVTPGKRRIDMRQNDDRSLNVIENKGRLPRDRGMFLKNNEVSCSASNVDEKKMVSC